MFFFCKLSRVLNMIGIDWFLCVIFIRFKCLIIIIILVEYIKWVFNLFSFVIIFFDFWDIYSLFWDVYVVILDDFYYKKKIYVYMWKMYI